MITVIIIITKGTAAVLDDVEVVTVGVICRGVEETTANVGTADDVVGGLRDMEDDVVGRGLRGTNTVYIEKRKHHLVDGFQ